MARGSISNNQLINTAMDPPRALLSYLVAALRPVTLRLVITSGEVRKVWEEKEGGGKKNSHPAFGSSYRKSLKCVSDLEFQNKTTTLH